MANVVLIATGGIRAPRQILLAEKLLAQGHRVRCLNTNRSLMFLIPYFLAHPLRFFKHFKLMHSPLSEILCYFSEFTGRVSHIGTSRWADVIVVAPATCNSIGKIANGITDNYPLLVVRAFQRNKKVLIAPSMNPEMWDDPFNQQNVEKIRQSKKYSLIEPVRGISVSGESGLGIMAGDDTVIAEINRHLELSAEEKVQTLKAN